MKEKSENNDKKSESEILRNKAESVLKNKVASSASQPSESDMVKLIYELEVHQAELEMQKEELIKARSIERDATEKYTNLYEFAPAGYFTISKDGRILDVNLSGTRMLGKDRSHLQNRLFGFLVAEDTRSIFNLFLNKVLNSKRQESCEVTLSTDGASPIYVHLTGVSTENGNQCLITALDITERKLADEQAYQLAAIVQSSEDAIIGKNLDGIITSWNKGAEKIYGYTTNEMIGKSISLLTLSGNDDEIPAILEGIKSGHVIHHYETSRRRKNGEEIQVSLTISPILDSDGRVIAVSTIARDITENKLVQEKLLSQSMLLEAQINATLDGILIVGHDNNRILINRRMIELFKVPAETIEDKNDSKLLEHVTNLTKNPDKFLEKIIYLNDNPDKESSDEIEFLNGMVIDRYSAPVVGRDGKNYGRIWIFRDITERKHAEKKVREKDIQFTKLSSQVPDLIFQFTKRPDGTYCVPIASTGIKNIFGCSPEDVHDDFGPIARVIFPEDSARVISDIEYSAQHLTYFTCEFRVKIPGKEIQWIFSRSVPEKLEDGSVTWYGFNTDITAIKYNEQELIKAKEKAEESDRLKSAFLANMSHEIRTPMNGILGFAGLLKEPDLSGEEQQKYIRIIEKSGARMLNIINNIIDISKIEAGLMEVDMRASNINDQIEDIYTFFKPEVEAKGMKLLSQYSLPSKDADIITDSNKFEAIITNLVKNAIKYTNHGTIEFGYTLVETQHAASPNPPPASLNPHPTPQPFLQFYVKDTGIGIPGDRLEAIFERFIQADISDKRALQGAGLGLAISKAYTEMLGGKLWVESEEGKGSIFYFTIPYNTGKHLETSINVAMQEDLAMRIKNLKILIAEDDETSDLLITAILKNNSLQVSHVNSGDLAVEACRDNPDLDLVFMDIKMPGIDGYEATRQIRQFNKNVIIIAQTAYGLSGDREKALESGCNDYISKPINKEELQLLLRKYFD